jgi:hypothetical protein
MTRSVVFKTKGKLDLRSIMTFGLNAKPNTGHPIGFFGTGLKYALAVLTREKIPVTIFIDGRRWTISTELSMFRDKEVHEIFLERHRTILTPSFRKLPFTTELGKTWKLWQAFRELHSNTLDEGGMTFVAERRGSHWVVNDEVQTNDPGFTCICVESEAFVQEYQDRDKTFLPDGLVQRNGTEAVQIFDRPSQHVYYRGIRVLDLDEKERSALTYNILSPIELTEDRTAKSKWDVQWTIQAAVAALEDKERIEKVIFAPKSSFEGSMNFYAAPSKTFLDVTSKAVETRAKDVTHHALEVVKQYKPQPPPTTKDAWHGEVIDAIRAQNWGVVNMYANTLIECIQKDRESAKVKDSVQLPGLSVRSPLYDSGSTGSVSTRIGDQTESSSPNTHAAAGSVEEDDDLPF